MLTAQRNLSTGDTTVIRNGVATPLSQAVGPVPVAGNASWFTRGEPLQIGSDENKVLYVTIGSARVIDANLLVSVGTVNGMPVYAERENLASALQTLGPNSDLSHTVNENKDVRAALENTRVLYAPLQTTGCVFQALELQVPVRK
jgi:hypothetical protein